MEPERWEVDVVLSDGGTARLRRLAPSDRDALVAFYGRVSDESKYLRFMQAHPTLTDDELDGLTHADAVDHVALGLELRDEVVAIGRYDVLPAQSERVAEVAFLVRDDQQGRGIAHLLLEHLAALGRERGVVRFVAEMLRENRRMIRVFTGAGYSVRPELADDLVVVDFTLAPTDDTRRQARRRTQRSQAAAIQRLLHPDRIAVVGEEAALAPWLQRLAESFRGEVVTRLTPAGAPRAAAELLSEVAGEVDLVVSAAGFDELDAVLQQAAAHDAHAVVALANVGTRPLDAEQARDLVRWARAHDVRVLGPESLGLLTTSADAPLNLTPAGGVRPGSVAVFAQSAGIAALVLGRALEVDLGISSFLSTGLFADLSGNDALRYWGKDETTRVVLLALDTVGNPRTFQRVVRRVAADKTVVLFAPARALRSVAPSSAGLPRIPEAAIAQAMRQTGAVVVSRRDAFIDVARIAARQPVPRGPRVAVVSNATRLADQVALAASRFGLQAARVVTVPGGPGVAARLAEVAHAEAAGGQVDAVVVAAVEIGVPLLADARAQLDGVAAAGTGVPVLLITVGLHPPTPDLPDEDAFGTLPVFDNYGEAVEALALLARAQPYRGEAPPPAAIDRHAADAAVQAVLDAAPDGGPLDASALDRLLAALDFTVQRDAPHDDAVKVIVAALEDGVLGPAVSLGVAGLATEVFGDTAWRVPPLDEAGARAMVDELRAGVLVTAAGEAPTQALAGLIARIAALKDALPEVVELALDVAVSDAGARVVGGSGRVLPIAHERDALARSLDR